jgi:hydrogenase expression/formation protein HypE
MNDFVASCPIPISRYPHVTLAHGGGGRLMNQLIEEMFAAAFQNEALAAKHDGASIPINGRQVAFSTDSYVVQPLFFPGGDIGSLAVHGTVNDLSMCGAQPLFLSCALILEEGLPMETLWRIVQSMRKAAEQAGVSFVTGDTKVVDRGKGDGVFINTSGIGLIPAHVTVSPARVRAEDVVIISGDVGRHGIAVMAEREGLDFETTITSDSAPLVEPVRALMAAGIDVHCMRDLTRGGLASSLVEISEASGLQIDIEDSAVPVHAQVRGACEILGLDPMYVANEGRFIVLVHPEDEQKTTALLAQHDVCSGARRIGRVIQTGKAVVTLRSRIGGSRIIDMLSGEQLPRIC